VKVRKINPWLLIGVLIAIFFGVSLLFRVSLPFDQVFSGEWIKFTSVDAYYHMRIVDNLVHNFPHLMSFDPYYIYPGGHWMGGTYFFDWLLAGIIWVIGLGSPSQHTVDVIGAYFPAILAALTVIPVYFIGKTLFNRWVGVLAAALIAVLPGEYLGRSILGFTDHHVAETLFSTVALLFVILAIKTAGQRQLAFSHFRQRDWSTITKPLVYSLLAGIFLGIYLITWQGALLFVFIITLYLIIQFIIDHLRGKSVDHLGIVGVVAFLIALIIFLPFSFDRLFSVAMVIALFVPLVLIGISRVMAGKQLKPAYYPLALVGIGIVFIAVFYVINPDLLGRMLAKFAIFAPVGATAATTLEMQPFLSPQGSFSLTVAWGNYTTGFYITLCVLIYLLFYKAIYRRQSSREENLLLVWSVLILVATLVQRRFAYYFVINVALLSAYVSWLAIWYAGLRKLVAKPAEMPESLKPQSTKVKPQKMHKERHGLPMSHINVVLAIIVVFLFVFFPNIIKAREVASAARFAPSDAWQSSLIWLKENSPDPFGETDFYYELYEPPPRGESYDYPESAYGVTTWWDYGYWVTRTAQRLSNVNPGQTPKPIINVAHLFLSQEEALTYELMDELDSSYVIIDYATSTSKFWAVVTWAEREQNEFVGIYHLPYEGEILPIQLFYPEYYRSLCIRLYNFDGKAVDAGSPVVVSYDEKVDREGNHYRQITDANEFSSYKEAMDYVESQGSGNHRIVGTNPFISPVPLEALENFKLIHSSEVGVSHPDAGIVPEVKIFEYAK